jgi:hypothetical protein
VPFLPFVLLIAWQAFSRSTSFALGWATSLYFGQVPGRQGRMLSVMSLMAAGWVIVIFGFAIPILTGAALEAAGVIEDNFDVQWLHYLGLMAAIIGLPPAVAAVTVFGEFHGERSIGTWMRLVPISYPATFMLGVSVLQMVAFTPFLLFGRLRRKQNLIQIPLVMREGTDDDDLVQAVHDALRQIGIEDIEVTEARGPKVWPMRTVGFATKHLLGAVVRGTPMHLVAGDLSIYAYATNISVVGPKEETYRVRAAVERELAFCQAYLTWNEDAQTFEDELMEAHTGANGDIGALRERLDGLQRDMDSASLSGEEWNLLYRLRLQVEQAAVRRADGQPAVESPTPRTN